MKLKRIISIFVFLVVISIAILPTACKAMPPGTILYRTTDDGKMYGYSGHDLIDSSLKLMNGINPGHVAIYVGQTDGIDYVVEAIADGVVKTKLEHFVNTNLGEEFIGAKIPKDLSPIRQAKVVALAKSLASANLKYDIDFKKQKGPDSGEWTCVGLVEKIYESADIANPSNISLLEYKPENYAIDITPDGFDDYSYYNREGDAFSKEKEFSRIAPRTNLILPLPETYGYNAGLIYKGDRYIFFPYTQFLQPGLKDVVVDRTISSSFDASEIRGSVKPSAVLLRWSLINNPISAVKIAYENIKEGASNALSSIGNSISSVSKRIFNNEKDDLVVVESNQTTANTNNVAEGRQESSISRIGGVTIASGNNEESQLAKGTNQVAQIERDSQISGSSILDIVVREEDENDESEIVVDNSDNNSIVSLATAAKNSSISASAIDIEKEVVGTTINTSVSNITIEPIKISKLYNTNGNDFIELYNPNNFSVNLADSNYRLEKTRSAVNPSIMIRIGNEADGQYPGGTTIAARGYYLIVRAGASNYFISRADAIASRKDFRLNSNAQTVYLGTGAISSYDDEDIVDVIGIGPQANYYLGSSPAPILEKYHFLNRIKYSNQNNQDYDLLLSADPDAISGWREENIVEEEYVEEVNANEEDEDVDEKESGIDEGNIDEEEEVDENEGEEEEVDENEGEDNGDDNENQDDDSSNQEGSLEEALGLVLINKVGVFENDDYIELFNYSERDIDLELHNFRLEKSRTATNPSIMMRIGNPADGYYPGGTIIRANSSYLIVRDIADQRFLDIADAIATRSQFTLPQHNHSIYLGTGPITSPDDEDIRDLLGYGPDSLYYQGAMAAPSVLPGYYLQRISVSGNNYLDFELLKDDYYQIEDDYVGKPEDNLFVFPQTQNSNGINNHFNFDACYDDIGGRASVGKWFCGREFGYLTGEFIHDLEELVDMNSFSVGFYYHPSEFSPKIDFTLANEIGFIFNVTMENGFLSVLGLPEGGIFYLPIEIEDRWQHFSLVVDQSQDYWAIYIDGEEIVRKYFLAQLPVMDKMYLSGGGGYMNFDELVFWDRPLDQDEIIEILENDLPFYPSLQRIDQEPAQMLYHFSFDEYGESITYDKVSQQAMEIDPSLWFGRQNNDYAMKVSSAKPVYLDFENPFAHQDISMSFWWKNTHHPGEGRATIALYEKNGDQVIDKFSITADYYRQLFSFGSKSGIMSEGINAAIPHDGKWHHLALVYDSYNYILTFYVNGEEKARRKLVRLKDGKELITSMRITSNLAHSAIDDLMIFSGALRAYEVEEVYHFSLVEEWEHY